MNFIYYAIKLSCIVLLKVIRPMVNGAINLLYCVRRLDSWIACAHFYFHFPFAYLHITTFYSISIRFVFKWIRRHKFTVRYITCPMKVWSGVCYGTYGVLWPYLCVYCSEYVRMASYLILECINIHLIWREMRIKTCSCLWQSKHVTIRWTHSRSVCTN